MSDRRSFLRSTFGTGTALTLGSVLAGLNGCARTSVVRPNLRLVRDPNGVRDLPAGFSCTVISAYCSTMSDGHAVPDYHDGMAVSRALMGQQSWCAITRFHGIFPQIRRHPHRIWPTILPSVPGATRSSAKTTICISSAWQVSRQTVASTTSQATIGQNGAAPVFRRTAKPCLPTSRMIRA